MSVDTNAVLFYGFPEVYSDVHDGGVDEVLERLGINLGEYGCDTCDTGDLVANFIHIHIGGYFYECESDEYVMVDLPTPSDEQIENLNRAMLDSGLKSDSMAGWYLSAHTH